MNLETWHRALQADFDRDGFVFLAALFTADEIRLLESEVDRELETAFGAALAETPSIRAINGHYLPLLRPTAPVTCALVEDARLVQAAELVLDDRVFIDPVSPGTVLFYGAAPWHRDADLDVPGVKFVSYFDTLREGAGALHLSRNSHLARRLGDGQFDGLDLSEKSQFIAEMRPGDVLGFDLRTWHANPTPIRRRQWTATYLRAPRDAAEREAIKEWLAEGESYETVEPLPNGLRWFDPDWVNDPTPSETKRSWLRDLAALGRVPSR